jgi:hypothetical protein
MNSDQVWKRVFYQPQDQVITEAWDKIIWPHEQRRDPRRRSLKAEFEGTAASLGQLQMQEARECVIKQAWDQVWEEIDGHREPP